MIKEPSGLRPHIILLGRRNVGKSSLVNALTEHKLALVSDVAGTTTDPVKKGFELLPFGPVVFVDTGGIDDSGKLGELRVERTRKELAKADFALLITDAGSWGEAENELIEALKSKNTEYIVVVNKTDLNESWRAPVDNAFYVSAETGRAVVALREKMSERLKEMTTQDPVIIGDIVKGGDLVALVVPIDLEAPKGRLILPQVMTIRDLLDNDAAALVVKERELYATLKTLGRKPDLVICDSQVVLEVANDIDPDIPMTTFSTVFARVKGDLATLVKGVRVIDELNDGDKVLNAEACAHHSLGDDIGRVKIPKWVRQYTGKDIIFEHAQGRNFPDNIDEYKLVIHCGACMITPKAMKARMNESLERNVPITNYGITISFVHGLLERVLLPFGGIDSLI